MSVELFQELDSLIPTLDGWCTPKRAIELAALVVGTKPQTTALLGTWGGRDTIALAMGHRYNGFGKVVCCDPYQAVASVEGQGGKDAEWWSNQQMHDVVYQRFADNIARLGLTQWIEFHKKRAAEVEPPPHIGVLVVDGNHGPESISDVKRWAPHVPVGSWVYADDINWSGGAVKEAVAKLLKMGFAQRYERDTGAFFLRVK